MTNTHWSGEQTDTPSALHTNKTPQSMTIKIARFLLNIIGGLALCCVLVIGIASGLQERIYNLGTYLWPTYSDLTLSQETLSSTELANIPCQSVERTSDEDLQLLDDLLLDDLLLADNSFDTPLDDPIDKALDKAQQEPTPEPTLELTTEACSDTLVQSHGDRKNTQAPQTIALRIKGVEQSLQSLSLWLTGQQSHILSLFILVCLLSATLHQKHLSLAPDDQRSRTSLSAQILSNLLICYACYEYAMHLMGRNFLNDNVYAYLILSLGFGLNLLLCLYYLVTRKSGEQRDTQSKGFLQALKSIPIYSWMILLSVLLDKERTDHELALLIGQIYEMPMIYLQIGLYIWLGMLIKHSNLAEVLITLLLSLIRNPLAVAFATVAFMAIPTAFTGASGIIILAMGGLVYQSLKKLPLRRQFILAITAMTGSTGVVLSPSLLIVAIAFLNKEVTTNELFYWGGWVFCLTLSLLIVITKLLPGPMHVQALNRTNNQTLTEPKRTPASSVIKDCIPYLLISGGIILVLQLVLGLSFNEFTAPYFLLLLMLGVVCLERRQDKTPHVSAAKVTEPIPQNKFRNAFSESFEHSGAILLVMLCSYSLGNTSFDPGWLNHLPMNGLSMVNTLCALVIVLIVIGMILDPFGALILVSMTLAPFAYEQGINPIHFWMITLVAFELAYVTPPVAMNHLLTRQQVPAREWAQLDFIDSEKTDSGIRHLYLKHERVILPILVLGTCLLIVTFMPLLFVS
ncbi:TRAP transporter large permease subunit [Litoribrevibacter albus]|uniref:Membrane protein n=1 Tax=Litoribrevibacter albus TaxID=1473156 RepID=A0AA37W7P2_9GAMM|nr:TRAP transporter large permease subunit [Litoribrevibacter albus]GLQ30716.1 membrane protein [Litoribrevibacter albus]